MSSREEVRTTSGICISAGLGLNFLYDFPAVFSGHIQVEDNKFRQQCVNISAAMEKKIRRFNTVIEHVKVMAKARLFEGLLDQKDIADAVFRP